MIISKAEIRLRRLLAAVPQQTNKYKQVHYVATLKELLATLRKETAESSSFSFTDAKAEVYSRYIAEVAHQLGVTKVEMQDVWESLGSEKGPQVSDQTSVSAAVKELAHEPSTSDFPLFPSCLKRKHSPDAGLLLGLEVVESEVKDFEDFEVDSLGKKICLDFNEYEAKALEEPMRPKHEVENLRKVRQEDSRENVTETSFEHKPLEHELENVGKLRQEASREDVAETSYDLQHEVDDFGEQRYKESREEEVEHFDSDSRLYICKHQIEQDKLVSEMLHLAKQIKESSLLLGHSLHDTEELLRSSEMTISHCLSATTSANLKTGELFGRYQERQCECFTWLSLLLMFFTFLTLVVTICVS